MNMQMPDLKKTKKMMKKAGELQLSSSIDAGMKIIRKNEMHPVKSWSLHKSCKIPLVKTLLVIIGVVAFLCVVMAVKNKMSEE